MRIVVRNYLALALAFGAVVPSLRAVQELAQAKAKAGAVFVMTNAASRNEVLAYERTADGKLYDAGLYATGGRGSGGLTDPLESQGSLTLSQDHSLLFAVNAGSGNISVFTVRRAALTLIDKVPSGGSQPVAVAQWDNLVYALNSGGSGNVVGFRLDGAGGLKEIKNSSTFLTANVTGGASLTISPDGRFLIVTERLANNIDAFAINSDGTLQPIVVSHSISPGVFSASFAPNGKLVVSETGPAGATNASAVSSYTVEASGMIHAISQSVPTLGSANCWNVVTPNGKWVYVSNAASATISGFAMAKNGTLTPVGATVVGANPSGSVNLDIAASGDNKYLFTLNSGAGNIGIFAIETDGTLLSLGQAGDLPPASGFNGIAAY